ncbi:MAG TPA: hypothetical protein PK159_16880, partial [Steroidobacteraceae bacterium]|nr:hypothetical protein [Steroidobacteraceae bacterium]
HGAIEAERDGSLGIVDNPKPRLSIRKAIQDSQAVVGTAPVSHYHLVASRQVCLREHRIEEFANVMFFVEARDNHAHERQTNGLWTIHCGV